MKYGCSVVFIRHDSAEMWGFKYGLTLAIGILKIMASTGVFVRVLCALKHSISGHGRNQSIILTLIKHKQRRSFQQNNLSKGLHQGRQRIKKQNANRE